MKNEIERVLGVMGTAGFVEKQVRKEAEEAGFASTMFEAVKRQIQEFEEALSASEDVGFMFANFGTTTTFRVQTIGFQHPHLIVMIGEHDGKPLRLLQHVSQVSLLLRAVPGGETPRKPIGFQVEK